MRDFSIVSAKTILRVTSVAPIRGFLPLSVIVLGEKFDLTKEVLYNDILAEEFIIASASRLIVRVPPSQVGKELTSIKVLSTVSVSGGSAGVVTELSRPIHTVSGIDRLIQAWIMIFLSNPGSDVFSPQSGGGARSLIGRSTDRKSKSVAADLALAIEKTSSEIKRLQAQNLRVPLEEKLLSGDLETLSFDEATTVLSAKVSIKNMIGSTAEISLR